MWREDATKGNWLPFSSNKSELALSSSLPPKERFVIVDFGLERVREKVRDIGRDRDIRTPQRVHRRNNERKAFGA